MKVTFTKERETLLATLYGRALDARSRDPILGDTMASSTVDRIDYDFGRLKMTPSLARNVAVRAKHFDNWARAFLANHPRATVVHLGAGLDTRLWRIDPGPDVLWFDVDYPDVVELRHELYPEHQTIGSSVTEPGWETQIPADRPTLLLAEGLSMYLTPDGGHALFRRLTDHFGQGELAFDSFNSLAIKLQKRNPPVRASGATLIWAIDDPHEIEQANPRLHLVEALQALYAPGTQRLTFGYRLVAQLVRPFKRMRNLSFYLRYRF